MITFLIGNWKFGPTTQYLADNGQLNMEKGISSQNLTIYIFMCVSTIKKLKSTT